MLTGAEGREDPPALIERDGEVKLIERALGRSAQGRGSFVILYGPAGMGRSSLLRASVLAAEKRGIATIEARGSELERGYGFGVVRQLLEAPIAGMSLAERRSLLRHAGPAAETALGIARSESHRSSAAFEQIEGVYRLIARLAAMRPLLVAVDDLQWCDRSSLDWLCFLGHRASHLPVTIIAAWRRGEPGVRAGRLQALAAKPETLFLTLAPLSHDGVRAVIKRESGSEPDEQAVGVVHAQTGGQPGLVSQLAVAMRVRNIPPEAGCRQAIEAVTPESVRRDLVARLGRHSETVRRFAEAVAVLEEGTVAQVAALADIDADRARAAAGALVRAGILRDESAIGYAQPLLRDAVYGTLSSIERAEFHRQAAVTLCNAAEEVTDAPDLERIAEHVLCSEPSGDQRFADVLREVARRATREGSLGDARCCLERALGEIESPATRSEVLVALAGLELREGHLSGAEAHASEACSLAPTATARAAAVVCCAEVAVAKTGFNAAVELLESEMVDQRDTDPDLVARLRGPASTLRACCNLPPARSADAPVRFDVPAGLTSTDGGTLAGFAAHITLTGAGNADQVRDLCTRALADVENGAIADAARYLACRAAVLTDMSDLVERELACCPDGPEEPGMDGWAVARLAVGAQLSLARGELARAEADTRAGLSLLADLPQTALHRTVRSDLLAGLVAILIELSRHRDAETALTELGDAGDAPGVAVKSLRIALALAQGTPDDALDWAASADGEPAGLATPGVSWRPWAAVAHHTAGDPDMALALAGDHLEHARTWGCPSVLGRALAARAIVDPGASRLHFIEEAVAVLEGTEAKLELARATIGFGASLRRARRRRDAREQLTRGADLAHQCGAGTLSAWARSELIAVGARPRRTAFSGVASLTVSELRVARLAATGMTNREIAQELVVSTKTVSGQLTAVYRKLDVHDRAALAAVIAADPPAPKRTLESVR
jgi:DNA-binding CsgD family transcriptional regulator